MKELYDVAVVGYGPAGEVLASTLGAAGLRVLVTERWPQPYPLPRLTTLDGEVCRVVQATGVEVDKAFESSSVQDACHFVDAEGEPLMVVRYPGQLGGWPSRNSVFQPDFEKAIAAKVERMPNVEVRRGWEALALEQDDDGVTLTIAPFDAASGGARKDASEAVRARYVVGTDGARSFVRQAIGAEVRDYDMHERWLNFDAENVRALPARFQDLKIFLDPARPHMFMPIGKGRLRLEFRVMEGETDEEMTDPPVAWEFLQRKHGLGPEDVYIMRQVVYHYHTRIAKQWRVGRVFLAGDAAHTMPPYMGQGGCAAVRDGRNLGWKLAEVLHGRSSPALLDTYGQEREPHVTTLVLASDRLSRVVNIVDPQKAEERNKGMRERGEGHPPELPSLGGGVISLNSQGEPAGLAGKFTPQGMLRRGDVEGRGDDLLAGNFQLWCRKDPGTFLGEREKGWLAARGLSIAVFEDPASAHAVVDVDGVYREFMDQHKVDVVLVRPDFYAFGAGAAGDLNAIVKELAQRLSSVDWAVQVV